MSVNLKLRNKEAIDVIVIGAGMYVCGKGTDSYGTILPSLFELGKKGIVSKVKVVGTKSSNNQILASKVSSLSEKLGYSADVEYYPKGNNDKDSYKKVIEEARSNSCVIISTPDSTHYDIAKFVLNNDFDCLVVKPLSATVNEVKQLIELKNSKNKIGLVEFHKRWDRCNLKIKDLIQNDKIGDPVYSIVEYSQRISIPTVSFKNWVKGTNIFQYLGVHYVDMIYFCTGYLPIRTMAVGQKTVLYKKGVNTYDSIQAVTEWLDKKTGNIFTSVIITNWIDPNTSSSMSDQKIKFIGSEGRIESNQKNRGLEVTTKSNNLESINPYFSDYFLDFDNDNYIFEGYGKDSISSFVEDVFRFKLNDTKIPSIGDYRPTFEEALISTSVIEGVNMSLEKNGIWVEISDKRGG